MKIRGGRVPDVDVDVDVEAESYSFSVNPAPQGQLATYKEMAAAAEEDRSRLEREVIATAQLATSVEARLRGALAAKDAAEGQLSAAEMRVHEVRLCRFGFFEILLAPWRRRQSGHDVSRAA